MKKLPYPLTQTQAIVGWFYFLLQLLVLPGMLNLAADLFDLSDVALNLASFSANFLCVFILFFKYLKEQLRHFLSNPGKCLLPALGLFVAYEAMSLGLGLLIDVFLPRFQNPNDANVATLLAGNYPAMFLCTVFLAPLSEEFFYRGLIFGQLYDRNPWVGYAVSTAAFALVHVLGYVGNADFVTLAVCFVQYVPAGLILAWAYARSGSLWVSILIHTAANFVSMLIMR